MLFILTGGCFQPSEWPNQIYRRINLSSTIEPDHPDIADLNIEFEERWERQYQRCCNWGYSELKIMIEEIDFLGEIFIRDKIKYKYDIENPNYPGFEHFPSASQALKGWDDCDGQAIVAASLLIHRGYDSYVIINEQHAWVITYLEDGTPIEVLKDPIPRNDYSWLVKWNDKEIYVNFTHPLSIIVWAVLLIIFLKSTSPKRKISTFFQR